MIKNIWNEVKQNKISLKNYTAVTNMSYSVTNFRLLLWCRGLRSSGLLTQCMLEVIYEHTQHNNQEKQRPSFTAANSTPMSELRALHKNSTVQNFTTLL